MSLADRLALALSLLAILVTYWVTQQVFEGIPHIEDEIAYVWQAKAIAAGHLVVPSPPEPDSFLVPFVVDHNGLRFGKYPLGWPVVLALGELAGARALVNPLLAGLGVWLTYRIGKKTLGEPVGLLAGALTITSPFFLMNSGSLLSHPFGLVLSAALVLAWLDAFGSGGLGAREDRIRQLAALAAGLSLGALVLTRPFTALAVGLPFGLHGLYLLWRGDWQTRRRVVGVGILAIAVGALYFLWQYAVTGDPLLNPYTLWWPYDQIGFGPGIGRSENGHSLRLAMVNTRFTLESGYRDLFGWGPYSWIFLPFGALAAILKRNWRASLVGSVVVSLVLFYGAYWVGAWLFGPRYYYEGLFSLTLFTSAGIAFLAGWPVEPGAPWRTYTGWLKARPLFVVAVTSLLVAGNLVFYTPIRLSQMHGLYGMQRSDLEPFFTQQARSLTPALVVVHPDRWMDYGVLLELQDPSLESPFIFIYTRGQAADEKAFEYFPDRKIIYYYPPDDPNTFYEQPKR